MSTVINDEQALENIKRNLTRLIGQKAITDQELADAVGTTQATIWRIKHGKNMPGAALLERIAEYFFTTSRMLMEAPPDMEDAVPGPGEKKSRRAS